MRKLFHILARLKRLQWVDIGHLTVLCLAAICVAVCSTTLTVGSAAFLLTDKGMLGLGFNYLLGAVLWLPFAVCSLKLKRRKGYGAIRTTALCGLFLWSLVWGRRYFPSISENLLFSMRYGFCLVLHVVLWSFAERFVRLSMSSLKYFGVFTCELVGVLLGGICCYILNTSEIMGICCVCCGLCIGLFYMLDRFCAVPAETFIREKGTVLDRAERKIADIILCISFCWSCVNLLIEIQLFDFILQANQKITEMLGLLYVEFACVGVVMMLLLARTRFLFVTPFGLIFMGVMAGLCAVSSIVNENVLLYVGVVLFWVSSHFYIRQYLTLLAVPLAYGSGKLLEKKRLFVMVPCSFLLIGGLLLTESVEKVPVSLLVSSVVLIVLLLISVHLYGRQLIRMCSLRLWREGSFMLSYAPLKQMIQQELSKKNSAEVIYFLNILAQGYAVEFYAALVQTIRHPSVSVRLFVLRRLDKLGVTAKAKKEVIYLMKNDTCAEVRNNALNLLICGDLERNARRTWLKYKDLLNKKEWVVGACQGFLSGRGVWLDRVIERVRKLADSKKTEDKLKALMIMTMRPRKEWVPFVEKFLDDMETMVVKGAIVVAGKLAAPQLLGRLLGLLDESRWRESVLETLNQYGKTAFPIIEKNLLNNSLPMDRRQKLILFLGRLPSGEGKQILLRALFHADRRLRSVIIDSLADSEIIWVHKDRKSVLKRSIAVDTKEWFEMRRMKESTDCLNEKSLQPLQDLFNNALQEEMERARFLILDQLELYNPVPLLKAAVKVLKSGDLSAYAGAISCLQDILPRYLYERICPILKYSITPKKDPKKEPITASVFLKQFTGASFSWETPWMQALALYGWRILGDNAGLPAVEIGLASSDWVVLETALLTLGRLEKNKSKVQERVLKIPTRYLLKQNFQELLEGKYVGHN